ncbi:MAG: hypothetical protein ACD_24C00471G0004 [uncultured bacterium]|uniref:HD domain-containing protein n=1 Tax=candidate division WWE3 bacterium RBG_16_37_10 TaxID=1802610 RepID=A0A1F4V466_UNCKA|nr:MAG: hypothetical protein ACD_24C00471G0004 [uncultured bacterium]OGC51929.1 MAG: hypothetical protein A2W32_01430 [candidate division WWE3 bacterium RBG_16_37_10]
MSPNYYNSARLAYTFITLQDTNRKVSYLNSTANGESIAKHITGVLILGRALAKMSYRKSNSFNLLKVESMLSWHDVSEAYTGDIPWDHRIYVDVNEKHALEDLFSAFTWGKNVISLIDEFNKRESLESNISRDADALYVLTTIRNLESQNYEIFRRDQRIERTLTLLIKSDEGKELAKTIINESYNNLWNKIEEIGELKKGLFNNKGEDLSIIVVVGWLLVELALQEGKKQVSMEKVLNCLLTNEKVKDINKSLAQDASNIYKIMFLKREYLRCIQDRKVKLNDKFIQKYMKNTISKLQTQQGKNLGKVILDMHPREWWHIMMGYAEITTDGSIVELKDPKPRWKK